MIGTIVVSWCTVGLDGMSGTFEFHKSEIVNFLITVASSISVFFPCHLTLLSLGIHLPIFAFLSQLPYDLFRKSCHSGFLGILWPGLYQLCDAAS